ncbi:response regulator [Leptolyngbya cf. ectocarpi LEGE 11479]|uniref:histidine kinase n=2 Tax=Leptolyngbya ectocarpi TaxID=1202 RepID=A0A928X4Q3_LEPEC|nr:response regulator [Leptolyngbya cf. ectocarpi LEGE 11479]
MPKHTCENSDTFSCTILIVDDSEADRVAYERYLTQSGIVCSTVFSTCGEDGLALCEQSYPDVLLLDYRLPDIDGLEFLQTLGQTCQPMPAVIMLTGQGSEQVAVEAMKMGATDYLIKGDLNISTLVQAVRRALTKQQLMRTIAKQQEQQQLMASISLRISQSLDVETSLKIAVEGARSFLDCDRTLIYQFQPDMNGTIVAESVLDGWSVGLSAEIEDTCFVEQGAERYCQGHKTVIDDIYSAGLTPCHIQLLEQFEVKANLVVPILLQPSATSKKTVLWGLLIAHHCHQPRPWQSNELSLLDDLSVQLAIAIQQNQFVLSLKERAAAMDRANRRLRKASQLLKKRNQELDQFAYIASHDLKAPLRAIKNLALWLQEDLEGQIPTENQQQIALMRTRVQRLESFIDGLLRYSRAGRESLETRELDPLQLLNEILDSLSVPESMKVTLPTTASTLVTEKLLLQQVLTNLISNAIKYHHRPDGHITISLKELGSRVEFTVADNGPGIAPDHHERIFAIFQTLESRDTVESTGIGLSIVKKIVEGQGGEITLTSEPGKGSAFSFTWKNQFSGSRDLDKS